MADVRAVPVRRLSLPFPDPRRALALGLLGLVGLLVVGPLVTMVVASFRPPATLPFAPGEWTLANYVTVFLADQTTWGILGNTAWYVVGTMALALPLAFGMAFITERTDVPMRPILFTLMFVPMVTPVFATALGWVLLAGPQGGVINEYIRLVFPTESRDGPLNIYTMWGMIFVTALGLVPSMWLLLVSVLRNLDPTLEEAAATSGIGPLATLQQVTLALARPGILAVVVYFAIVVIDSFEIPLALGISAGVLVLSTKIYLAVTSVETQAFDYGGPAAFGMLGVVLAFAGIGLYLWLIRRASRFAVVTGKAYRPRVIRLGKWKYVALAAVGLYILIKVVLPFALLIYASFLRFYVPPLPGRFDSIPWTLDNYRTLLDMRFFGRQLINTLFVVVGAASLTMLLASLVGWSTVRLPSAVTRLTNMLTFVPLALPGVIVTLAILLMFIGTPLYGSLALITLAFVVRYLSYSTRLMHAAQIQIHRELEEASLTSSVGEVATFVHVNLRLLLPAFVNGWLWIVTHAAKDFTTPLLLASSGSQLVANVIYGRFTGGRFPESAAAMVLLVVLLIAVVAVGRRWTGETVRA
jgi:iron(III) transport system permease protein